MALYATKPAARAALRLSIAFILLAGLSLAVAAANAGAGGASCNGKKATITSDGAKIVGTKAPDVIVAGSGDNTIYGEGGDDLICAGDGNDTIFGGRGNDTANGEGGDDSVHGERGSDDVDGGGGQDRVLGESGNDQVGGGAGDHDQVEAGPGDDSLNGGAGDFDVLTGGPGNDAIDGGPGAHDIASYAGAGGAVTIDLGSGTVGGAESEHLSGIEDAIGSSGDDTLTGDANANRLDGGPGNDNLNASGSGDEAFGGPGSDQCGGGFDAQTSCGPESSGSATAELYDSIDGSDSLIVNGTSGADEVTVSYSGGAFVVQTGAGTETIPGHADSIIAAMGAGNDSVTIADSVPAGISANLEGGKGSDILRGGPADDVLYAGEDHDPDTLEGGGGDDVEYGVNIFHPRKDSGAATLVGGPGDDLMIGGQPCDGDSFDGGPGDNDSASFARVRNDGIFVNATIGGAVTDPGSGGGCTSGHIDPSVEKIEGSPGPDILTGDASANKLLGRGGNDRLDGDGGGDECVGGTGDDTATACAQVSLVP
jgi:Ca2+-binding RTX toxin-like protein